MPASLIDYPPENEAHTIGARAQQALDETPDFVSSRDVHEASRRLSGVYNSNRLSVVGQRSDFHMNLRNARIGNLGLATLAFGAEVEIEQSGDRPFCLVTTQVSGSSRVATKEGEANGGCGFIVVDNPGERVNKRFSADSRRCNVRIEQSTLEAKCVALLQRPLDRPLRFSSFSSNARPVQRRWFGLLQLLIGYADAGPSLNPVLQSLEEAVLLHLLLEHQHTFSEVLCQQSQSVAPRHVRRAEDFMRGNAREALTLETVAREAGCSIRSLNDGFRKYREMTPMDFLRQIRLEGVRAELTQGVPFAGIAEVAMRWGFSHLGRFSGYYRSQFGELPSDTLRKRH